VSFKSPRDAIQYGIGMVHQHFMLIPVMTVAENIVLGTEPTREGVLLDYGAARARVRELAGSFGFAIDPDARIENISVGQEQRVEILKALYRGVDLLILDEPTAVLTPQESDELFTNLRTLRDAGKTIVFISHKLDEVLEIADRITVLRRGKVVGEANPTVTTKEKLAEMMVGRPVLFELEKPEVRIGEPVLRVEGLWAAPALRGIDLEVRAGEILGIAGVEGNGQLELAEAVVGLRPARKGRIDLDGADVTGWSVDKRRDAGLAFVPADRHGQGLVLNMSLWENAILGRQDDPGFSRFGLLLIRKIKELAGTLIRLFDVRARSLSAPAASLSGGNQQKLILARELESDPRLLVAAQPTRGLDVGSIEFVWSQLLEQKSEGRGILLISAELDEIYALSDRILTIFEGRFTGEYSPDASPEQLGLAMTGDQREEEAS
jgi:ABC-type uncharacterized transport system ATPase subunit